MKKLVVMSLLLALTLTVVGCGSKVSPAEPDVEVSEEETVEEEVEEEAIEEETSVEEDDDADKTTEVITVGSQSNSNNTNVDPYSGFPVANVHSVVLPKGVNYDDAIDAVIAGSSAYPNTYPYLEEVNFNVPGVYNCYWATISEDREEIVPIVGSNFTVTITE